MLRSSGRARRDLPAAAGSRSALDVFTVVLSHGRITRSEIAARTGLSPAAVTKAVRPLLAAGLLSERTNTAVQIGAGRPVQIVEVVADRRTFIGIKVTAERVVGVCTDLRGQILAEHEVKLVRGTEQAKQVADTLPVSVGAMVQAVTACVAELSRGRAPTALGVAVSGDVDRAAGQVVFSPLLGWRNVDLAALIEDSTKLSTVIENDVRAVTIAEQWFGAGVGIDNFAVVTIGTGIGCGLVVDGQVLRGSAGVSGELGHLCVDVDGPACHCGGRGCIEAYIGRAELLAAARRLSDVEVPDLDELYRLAHAPGGERLRDLLDHSGRRFGAAIAGLANLIGPRRILISAEGFDADRFFGAVLRQTIAQQCFGRAGEVELIARELPFSEWACGAAVSALTEFVHDLILGPTGTPDEQADAREA